MLRYILFTAITALVVWFVLPKNDEDNHHGKTKNMFITPKLKLIFDKNIFFIAITVVCAYCGYKGLDNITLYLVQTLNWHEASAASFAAYATYLRPISAISAGVIADKFDCSKTIKNLFLISILVYLILFSTTPNNHTAWIIYLNILLTFVTVFALRGIYFALLQDAQFPQSKTGVIVGFVSLIGYTPDIFFGSLTGRILDNSPGVAGHQNYFLFLMLISILGLITTYFLSKNKTVK